PALLSFFHFLYKFQANTLVYLLALLSCSVTRILIVVKYKVIIKIFWPYNIKALFFSMIFLAPVHII
ncbi:hypothetical protein PD07_15460, partial [Escherichia coli]